MFMEPYDFFLSYDSFLPGLLIQENMILLSHQQFVSFHRWNFPSVSPILQFICWFYIAWEHSPTRAMGKKCLSPINCMQYCLISGRVSGLFWLARGFRYSNGESANPFPKKQVYSPMLESFSSVSADNVIVCKSFLSPIFPTATVLINL